MRDFEDLLPTLKPPDGGLERLRHTISADGLRARARRHRWEVALAGCVAAAALAIWMPQWIAQRQRTRALVAALQTNRSPQPPAGGIQVARGAAIRLPSGQSNVRLYLVQSAGVPASTQPLTPGHAAGAPR